MTSSNVITNRLPSLDSNDAHEQPGTIQIRIQVLEQSKQRDSFKLIKVQLELCYISQVQFSLILSLSSNFPFPLLHNQFLMQKRRIIYILSI